MKHLKTYEARTRQYKKTIMPIVDFNREFVRCKKDFISKGKLIFKKDKVYKIVSPSSGERFYMKGEDQTTYIFRVSKEYDLYFYHGDFWKHFEFLDESEQEIYKNIEKYNL